MIFSGSIKLVYAIHRKKPDWLANNTIETVTFDLNNPTSIQCLLKKDCIVINMLRPDGKGWFPKAIVNACKAASIKRYIHLSSIDIYGKSKTKYITSKTAIEPCTSYEKEHAAGEAYAFDLTKHYIELVILRLGAIFGIGGLNIVSFVDEINKAPIWKLAIRRMLYGTHRMHLVSVERVLEVLLAIVNIDNIKEYNLFLITEDDEKDNNFAYLQDNLIRLFERHSIKYIPHIPLLANLLFKFHGLDIARPVRRFIENNLENLGVPNSISFQTKLSTYINYLKKNHENCIS